MHTHTLARDGDFNLTCHQSYTRKLIRLLVDYSILSHGKIRLILYIAPPTHRRITRIRACKCVESEAYHSVQHVCIHMLTRAHQDSRWLRAGTKAKSQCRWRNAALRNNNNAIARANYRRAAHRFSISPEITREPRTERRAPIYQLVPRALVQERRMTNDSPPPPLALCSFLCVYTFVRS